MIETCHDNRQSEALRPGDPQELADLIREASEKKRSFEIVGGGSKRTLGDIVRGERTIQLSKIAGIEFYEPDELVIKVAAGTTLAALNAALAEHGQFLPFDPLDLTALYGTQERQSTIGGVISCNLSGPRRILSGAARDAVLGIEAVNGRGERFKAGGRTIKNVTGFDISRLMAASFGTLSVMTSVTLKVLPAPQSEMTLLVSNLCDRDAIACLSALLGLPYEISAASHLGGTRTTSRTTAVRIDGFADSVVGRTEEVAKRLQRHSVVEKLQGEASRHFWTSIGNLSEFSFDPDTCIWQLSLPCEHAAAVVEWLDSPAIYDWGGGRVFVRTSVKTARSHGQALRGRLAASGGNASLLRAPSDVREALGVFQPRSVAVNRLTERVREAFDPNQVLNPGKLASLGARN